MRRIEESLLHGPWADVDAPEDVQLEDLRDDYGRRWRIWRAMSEHQVAGDWHARRATRATRAGALRELRADTADGLRRALQHAEAVR